MNGKNKSLADWAAALLIFLFAYAALSKLLDFGQFVNQMHEQPFPNWMATGLSYLLPLAEIIAIALLLFKRSRTPGLWLSMLLMASFTVYVNLAYLHFWDKVPCSCGGILKQLSWKSHLVLNDTFLIINAIGLYADLKERRVRQIE